MHRVSFSSEKQEKSMRIFKGTTTVKPVYNGHSQKDQKLVITTNYCLMQVKSFAECSK